LAKLGITAISILGAATEFPVRPDASQQRIKLSSQPHSAIIRSPAIELTGAVMSELHVHGRICSWYSKIPGQPEIRNLGLRQCIRNIVNIVNTISLEHTSEDTVYTSVFGRGIISFSRHEERAHLSLIMLYCNPQASR
jgi:hypothetical protein